MHIAAAEVREYATDRLEQNGLGWAEVPEVDEVPEAAKPELNPFSDLPLGDNYAESQR